MREELHLHDAHITVIHLVLGGLDAPHYQQGLCLCFGMPRWRRGEQEMKLGDLSSLSIPFWQIQTPSATQLYILNFKQATMAGTTHY